METKVDRLIDYFAVVGLGDGMQPNNTEKETGDSYKLLARDNIWICVVQIEKSLGWKYYVDM